MRAFIGRCQQMMSPLRSPALRGITSLQNRRRHLLLRSSEAMTDFADSVSGFGFQIDVLCYLGT
jgi:hypothetical protein